MKKKLLIYAHYYAPDVASTGQLLQDLAEGMKNEFDITVICTVPSYTGKINEKYKNKKYYRETFNGINLIRVAVPEFSKKSIISRVKNLLVYFIKARKVTKKLGFFDYVYTISQPPIMGGVLGLYGKKKVRGKLIYCIQDFNPEQIEATGYIKNKPLLKVAKWLDKRTCKKSDLVITVGRDLVETLKKRFEGKKVPKFTMINNWIDDKKIYPLNNDNPGVIEFKEKHGISNKYVIMYSGSIGLYYDLEGLLTVIEKFKEAKTPDGSEVVFAFVGEGSVLDKLVEYKKDHKLDNVVFIPYQDKDKLNFSLNAANVHWCVNAKGIKGVSCPSKFYGIAGVGKPVLGVLENGSEVALLINEIGCGLNSEPGEYEKVEENIKWFIDNSNSAEAAIMGKRGYDYLVNYMTKDKSIKKSIEAINNL